MIPDDRPELVPLYIALGRALSGWAIVENALGQCYAHCVGRGFVASQKSAVLAYWSVYSFNERLNMADAVITPTVATSPDLASKWDSPRDSLGKKNRQRNKLAHGSMMLVMPTKELEKPDAFLVPYAFSQLEKHDPTEWLKSNDFRPKQRLYVHDIDTMRAGFVDVRDELREFGVHIIRHLATGSGSP
jgi:hypothetical protein